MRAIKVAAAAALAILALAGCASTQPSKAINTTPVAYTEAFGTPDTVDWGVQCAPYLSIEVHGDSPEGTEGFASPEEAILSSLKFDSKAEIDVDKASLEVVAGAPDAEAFSVEVLVSTDKPVLDYSVSSSGKGDTWIVDGFTQCSNQQIIDGQVVTDK